MEVLVGSPSKAGRSKEHICRVLKAPLVTGMFCKVGRNAYITSPELTFIQMATRLETIHLVLLGMELCGAYAPCPYSDRSDGRPPVTSKERILSLCKRAQGIRGGTTAAKVLHWVLDNSNSPAETALVLYLCLPVRLGGYGFEFPDMNPVTPLGKRASQMLGQKDMRCDLHWVDRRTVVEYDSDQEHLTSRSASKDASRRNVLGYKDIEVITVRNPMITSPHAFNSVAKQLAHALGRRLRPRDMELTPARAALRVALFPWLKTGY